MTLAWLHVVALTLTYLDWTILVYFLFVNSFYALLLLSAAWEMLKHMRQIRGESYWRVLGSRVAPSITMLAPAYNEAATIRESVHAILSLHYPNLEVLIVNDGSTDETLAVLKEHFDLVPIHPIYRRQIESKTIRGLYRSRNRSNLLVVDKDNGGKADALNAGLQMATGTLVCAMDADTLIEPDALLRMVRPFLLNGDVLAAGGTIRVVNGSHVERGRVITPHVSREPIAGFQTVEYLRAFLFGRLGWNRLGGNLIISGAFGLFRREAMIAAGGYAHDTVGEDMELVFRLRRHGYESNGPHRIDFVPDPVAWTEAPASLRMLGRQRDRWHRGLADTLWRHRRILFNPRYGAMGLVVYPYFLFVELLAPVMETLGLCGLLVGLAAGVINLPFALLYFLVAYGYGLVLSAFSLVLDEINFHRYEGWRDRLLLILWAMLEPFGYRLLTVFWRLRGLVRFCRGRMEWGTMERRGFHRPDKSVPVSAKEREQVVKL
jgi:cellulose synthase/poly-beta-1,6-N-acetylglucosamine synthase-like glycosyltransferase